MIDFQSDFKIPFAGGLSYENGNTLEGEGFRTNLWSSSPTSDGSA